MDHWTTVTKKVKKSTIPREIVKSYPWYPVNPEETKKTIEDQIRRSWLEKSERKLVYFTCYQIKKTLDLFNEELWIGAFVVYYRQEHVDHGSPSYMIIAPYDHPSNHECDEKYVISIDDVDCLRGAFEFKQNNAPNPLVIKDRIPIIVRLYPLSR